MIAPQSWWPLAYSCNQAASAAAAVNLGGECNLTSGTEGLSTAVAAAARDSVAFGTAPMIGFRFG